MRKQIGFWLGIGIFLIMLLSAPPEGLSPGGWRTAAVGLLMAAWWVTEALPIPVTALVPMVAFPLLGIADIESTTSPYAHPIIFLFMGGFFIAIAMEKWELHKRIALNIVRFVGTKPHSIILGFILACALLSMGVSNTATALMMLPIGISVMELIDRQSDATPEAQKAFGIVLMLSIAYACNIGGMGTLIGTGPNAILAGYIGDNFDMDVGFLQWMMVGLPLVIVSLPIMYYLLTRVLYPVKMEKLAGGRELIHSQLRELGDLGKAEKMISIVFGITALLWISRPLLDNWLPGLSDTGIAVGAAVVLFILPVHRSYEKFVLHWSDAKELPWGLLILFGGGLSLAAAISDTGLAEWIGTQLSVLSDWPQLVLTGLVVLMIIFLTEITSNTATTAAFLPIVGSVAIGIGLHPLMFAMPAALAASCAFMLPVATPPNAIVYGSERLTIPEMAKAGFWLNLVFVLLITLLSQVLVKAVFF